MITKETIRDVIADQLKTFHEGKTVEREIVLPEKTNRIIVISGIRRCGKSTLMKQKYLGKEDALYINFEDPRLVSFELSDFTRLEEILIEQGKQWLLFDEIQVVDRWELYVRSAHERNIHVVVSGSNASMLSKKLGTKLTGRYLQKDLFPFNYNEFLAFADKKPSVESFMEFFEMGGFPEFLEEPDADYHRTLLMDIVVRDIAVRRNLPNENQLLRLVVHFLSNIGKEFSYNKLSNTLEIKSVRTIIDYCDYLVESYLIDLIPMFSWSFKKQIANAKKVYAIDAAFAVSNSLSFSKDFGRRLENIVYNKLRAEGKDVHYFKDKKNECDFVVNTNGEISETIQVCWEMNADNIDREIQGLRAAMKETKSPGGYILTLNQEDNFDGIPVIPVWKWL